MNKTPTSKGWAVPQNKQITEISPKKAFRLEQEFKYIKNDSAATKTHHVHVAQLLGIHIPDKVFCQESQKDLARNNYWRELDKAIKKAMRNSAIRTLTTQNRISIGDKIEGSDHSEYEGFHILEITHEDIVVSKTPKGKRIKLPGRGYHLFESRELKDIFPFEMEFLEGEDPEGKEFWDRRKYWYSLSFEERMKKIF